MNLRWPTAVVWLALSFSSVATVPLLGGDVLAEEFQNPPDSARPLVFWQWMNGCVTKEGITSDLESFKRAGVGGVQNFLVGGSEAIATDPSVQVLNPKWRELMAFAISECARLGLSFGTHNCPGWSASGSPGVRPEDAMKKLVWTVTEVAGGTTVDMAKLPQPAAEGGHAYYRDVIVLATHATGATSPQEVVRPVGSNWPVPPGTWRIYRFGETLTGSINGTGPVSGQGLEVDKLSRAALDRFWPTYPAQVIALAGKHAGKTFTRLELDSYEAGPQEWTTDALPQFEKIAGYDPRPWLPVLAGQTVGDAESSERFREDWSLMVAQLMTENYFGHLGELIRQNPGMEFLLEPYATGKGEVFSTPEVSAKGDQLMAEFWWGPTTWGWDSIKPVASAAHTLGKRIVLAEAFTGQPQYAWRVAPADLKAPGDRAFAAGINHMILHAAAHQPWPAFKPGMTMGWWGTQFGPGQTWWEHGGPEWLTYLARCQVLLRQGVSVGDLAFLTQERMTPEIPAGHDGDTLGESVLLGKLSVRNERLVLPDGVSYRVLILPKQKPIKLEVLEKLRTLVEQGATIAGPRPARLWGMRGGSGSEQRFKKLRDELWGGAVQGTMLERRVGQGRVLSESSAERIVDVLGAEPDVDLGQAGGLLWTHRRTENDDIYFVSNQGGAASAEISFKADAPVVEIWRPDLGTITPCRHATRESGRTRVRLSLDASGSCFVLFRHQPTAGRVEKLAIEGEVARRRAVDGAWSIHFPADLGAPSHVTLDRLTSWTENPDDGVRHFSGTATYARSLEVPADFARAGYSVLLDLGRVQNVARVRLNGMPFPALWKPPYRLDVTQAVRVGENTLEIEVTNLWPNRLIGDAREPEDAEWGSLQQFKYVEPVPTIGRPLLKIPEWIIDGAPRPAARRVTFTTYDFFRADDLLIESGLLGPVAIEAIVP